jgi:hypothetical protein
MARLRLYKAEFDGWVALPEILDLKIASHTRRIFELRQDGHEIERREL